MANNPASTDPTSKEDFLPVVHQELEGGSGGLAHASYGSSIESKPLAMDPPPFNIENYALRNKKSIEAMRITQPVAETELQANGIVDEGAPLPKRARVKQDLQGGDFNDAIRCPGQNLPHQALAMRLEPPPLELHM